MSTARSVGTFFYNHKFAIASTALDLTIELFNHSWAGTAANYSLGWKIVYMGAMPLLKAASWGIVGHGVDKITEVAANLVTESSSLLQRA
jgi:hypothetical protein